MADLGPIFRRAAELLDERGWCQGRYVNENGSLCAGGALGVALGATPNLIPQPIPQNFKTWTGMDGGVEEQWIAGIALLIHIIGKGGVAVFNDKRGRTADEVKALLLRAAEEADRG